MEIIRFQAGEIKAKIEGSWWGWDGSEVCDAWGEGEAA